MIKMMTLVPVLLSSMLLARDQNSSPVSSPTVSAIQAQNEVLRAQLQTMQTYDQRLLTTVYFSLSTVVLLVLAVVGLNFFSNYRLYQRDKESLRTEFRLFAEEQLHRAREKLEEDLRRVTKELTQGVDETKSELGKNIASAESRCNSYADSLVKSTNGNLLQLAYDVRKFSAEYFEKQLDWYGSVQSWIEFMEIIADLNWPEHFGVAIKGLGLGLSKGASVSYSNLEKALRLLDKFPPHMRGDATQLRVALETAHKL